jgi:hypothetical protein
VFKGAEYKLFGKGVNLGVLEKLEEVALLY